MLNKLFPAPCPKLKRTVVGNSIIYALVDAAHDSFIGSKESSNRCKNPFNEMLHPES
jgi:hypothetical protein